MQLISSTGFYGAEKVVVELSQGLRENGHEVTVAGLVRSNVTDTVLLQTARSLRIPTMDIVCRRKYDRTAVTAMRRWVTDNDIDIIHSHGYKSNFYALLARPSTSVRLVATCHNWPGTSLKMRSYQLFDKALLRKFDRVVAVSEGVREQICRAGMAAGKVVTIHNGIRRDEAARRRDAATLRRELGIGTQDAVVTAVGRLSPEKGFSFLIAAAPSVFADVPNARFIIVGDGPQRRELEAFMGPAGGKGRIQLLGTRDDVHRILSASDVFVMPSLDEGMPMALLEAMYRGMAIVASRVGGIPRMIDSGVEGILVAPQDSGALGAAIVELLRNPRKAERMGNSALRRAAREFSSERMTQLYMKVYGELNGGKGSKG